jgi:plastocyanin
MTARTAVPAAALAATTVFFCLQAAGVARPGADAESAQSEVPAKARVFVKDNYFEPRSTEVLEGGQVTWKWRGENRHNIRFTKVPEGAARKGASLRTAGKWKRTFRRAGVYRYVCKVWSGMRGSVTVRAEQEPPSPQ